jgi:predicted nuclease with TOPRIM domain
MAAENQEVQEQLRRLQVARTKCEEFVKEQNRLTGEQGALQTQMSELEAKSLADFGCSLSGLPDLLAQLKESSATALSNAEVILGTKEGAVAPVKAAAAPSKQTRQVRSSGNDEDSLP